MTAVRMLLGLFVASAGPIGLGLMTAGPMLPVERLTPVFTLPARLMADVRDPGDLVKTRAGAYLILDHRAQTVFRFTPDDTSLTRLLPIGTEGGHVLDPSSLAISRDDIFAVLDVPNGFQRIQYFTSEGRLIGGFALPVSGTPRLVVGEQLRIGVAAMAFTGQTFLVNEPQWGSLFAELDTTGHVLRHIGTLRPTGHEDQPDVHQALNVGLPLVDPTGGFFFVFQTGEPAFRKYDESGHLVYERHIEGTELDGLIQALPNRWRPRSDGSYPLPPPLVRTAAVDRHGRLWVSLQVPYTYVYDPDGEKVRVVLFEGRGILAPSSLFFEANGRLLVGPRGFEFNVE